MASRSRMSARRSARPGLLLSDIDPDADQMQAGLAGLVYQSQRTRSQTHLPLAVVHAEVMSMALVLAVGRAGCDS